MVVEVIERARRPEALDVFRRGVSVEAYREQLALDQMGLCRQPQPNRHISLAHREMEFFVSGNERDVDIRIKRDEVAQSWGEPMQADHGSRGHPQRAIRPLATV